MTSEPFSSIRCYKQWYLTDKNNSLPAIICSGLKGNVWHTPRWSKG